MSVRGADEVTDADVRQSAITSHAIGIPELGHLFGVLPADADQKDYRRAVVNDNALGLGTESGRVWRFKTLRRLYLLQPGSVLFRSLRDLWDDDQEARPLLATLCAMARDTVFRASSAVITETAPDNEVTTAVFAETVEARYPGVYAASSLAKVAANAYASWQQSGHLGPPRGGRKVRTRATCRAANVAYALLLGHLEGYRGEALFETSWAQILDQPRSQLHELAFAASQRGMIEYRNAGGIVEVEFGALLRSVEGELL